MVNIRYRFLVIETVCSVVIITSEHTSHIHVDFFLGLFFLLGFFSGGSGGGGTSSTSGSGGTGGDVSEELGNILSLEGLGEKSGPVGFDGVS